MRRREVAVVVSQAFTTEHTGALKAKVIIFFCLLTHNEHKESDPVTSWP